MSEFTKAAERAADAVMNIASDNNIYNTDRYRESDIWEKITNKMEAEIAKHFADLAATYELLVELAITQEKRFALYDMMCEAQNPDLSDDKRYELEEAAKNAPDYESRAMELLASPLIQRAIGGTE